MSDIQKQKNSWDTKIEINNELLEQWEPKIHRILQTTFILGMDRDDVAQELRIAIVKAATHFDGSKGVSFHTYLHTVMFNTIRTFISKAQKNKDITEAVSIDGTHDAYTDKPAHFLSNAIARSLEDSDSSEFTEEIELEDILERAELTQLEKDFLDLRIDGLTMEQISNHLHDSAYKIRSSLQKKLYVALKEGTVGYEEKVP